MLLTDTTGILEVTSPGQAQRAALKVSIGEHVGQAEMVVVFLCKIHYMLIFTTFPVKYYT